MENNHLTNPKPAETKLETAKATLPKAETKPPKKILGRSDILSIDDIETQELEIKEWGGAVLVRSMTGTERDEFETDISEVEGDNAKKNKTRTANIRAKFVQRVLVDEDGNRLFTSADIIEIGRKNSAILDKVMAFAKDLSGIDKDSEEELEKN